MQATSVDGERTLDLAYVFLTGAVTLAMELLASRILTPYFGVSLLIWSGILSITLIALALGYYLGGRATRTEAAARTFSLDSLFLAMPTLSGSAILVSCLLYPKLFHTLGSMHLVVGAYMACMLLIFFPLVAVSAMNPLLIAIQAERRQRQHVGGDSGSGTVFFVSTVGSVVGVSLTAFVFIPNLTNFNSMLILATTLSTLSLAGAFRSSRLANTEKRGLLVISAIGIVLALGTLSMASRYLKKEEPISFGGGTWTLEREYTSLFGNTKILTIAPAADSRETAGGEKYGTLYYADGITMNIIDAQGNSLTPFTYALEFMARGLRPDAERALVLGLGAGIIPMRLEAAGIDVDVVEINPSSIEAAEDYFGFDRQSVHVVQADARTFVRDCPRAYDVVLIDMSHGDGLPEYLLSVEFFSDVRRCLTPDGIAVFNTFAATAHLDAWYAIMKTLGVVFPDIRVYHDGLEDGKPAISIYLAAFQRADGTRLRLPDDPVAPGIAETIQKVFSTTRPVDRALLQRAEVLRDERNRFSLVNLASDQFFRESILLTLPPEFLVN